ncbi:hypothetical protein ACGFY7_49860 [Streptomyces prunicolor]|uniref:hypothetical protein n=1 Tax=Streptomyces prunicolor TaxID=67348 RepID=UPI0037242C53
MDHHGAVLAQRQVASKSNDLPSFAPPLLDGLELEKTVVTADALHTQHGHGAYLTSRGARYVAVVKKNHPRLYALVRTLPWRDIPVGHCTRDHAHHCDEIRWLKAAAFSHLDYPGAHQVIQVVRWQRDLSNREANNRARLPDHQPERLRRQLHRGRHLDQRPLGHREPPAPRA